MGLVGRNPRWPTTPDMTQERHSHGILLEETGVGAELQPHPGCTAPRPVPSPSSRGAMALATPRRHAPCLLLESLSPASSLQPLGELLLQFWWLTTHLRMLEATVRRKSSERTPRPRPRACAGDGNSASASHSLPGHPTACGGLTPASEPSGGRALPHCPHPPPPHSSSLLCGGESHPPQDLHPSCASTLPTGPAAESTHPVSCPSPAPPGPRSVGTVTTSPCPRVLSPAQRDPSRRALC